MSAQQQAESEKEIKSRIDAFFGRYANSADARLEMDAPVRLNPHRKDSPTAKVAIAVYYEGGYEEGISYGTYEQFRDYIEKKLAEAQAKHAEYVASQHWVVCALTDSSIQHVFRKKALPYAVYKAIGAHYLSKEDLEEFDEFFQSPRWEYDPSRLKEEALKVATKEQLALAEKINKQKAEREAQRKQRELEEAKKVEELLQALKIIDSATANATRIPEESYEPVGDKIQDPRYPEDIYGGGHWWVIEPTRILTIYNNGADGDDWSLNNIRTGGAGAIGSEIPRTEEVVSALQTVKELGSQVDLRNRRYWH